MKRLSLILLLSLIVTGCSSKKKPDEIEYSVAHKRLPVDLPYRTESWVQPPNPTPQESGYAYDTSNVPMLKPPATKFEASKSGSTAPKLPSAAKTERRY